MLEIQDLVIHQVDRRIAGMNWDEIATSEDLYRFLQDLDGSLDDVDAIWLTAPQGVTMAGSRFFPALKPDVSHREHFTALRGGAADIVITRAFRETVSRENYFVVARRRTPPAGAPPDTFDGLIAVAIRADNLLRPFREAAPNLNHSVGLIRQDGAMLVRDAAVPPPNGEANLRASPFFQAAIARQPAGGSYVGVSSVDGVTRMVAYRKVGKYPLYILLAAGTDAVLLPWRQHVAIYGLLCGGAALSLSLMTLLALRQSRRERAVLVRLEQEAKARELAEAALRQSQKLEAIGKLTGGIAHDFNNLLTAVIGSLETARARLAAGAGGTAAGEGRAAPDLDGPLDIALQGANRAATLTQRLLAFARKQPLNPRAEDLNALVSGLAPLLRRSLSESTELETDLAPGLWVTSCDPGQMETALLNLAINARDAMPAGGRLYVRTENVTLDAAMAAAIGELEPGDHVRLSVTDTGDGMPEDVRVHAFDPFFTTKPVGQGTGLGLSQVYGIVRQSGGGARILSTPGQGTTVEIFLPRHRQPVVAPVATLFPHPAPVPGADPEPVDPGGPIRILLVEDEAIVRVVAAEALRGAGYEVEEADEAVSALELIERAPPFRLLVTDVGLPGMNGRQLAESAVGLRPGLKVMFMTGYAGIATDATFAPGALLAKPFTPDALIRKVGAVLAERQAAD